MANLKKRLKDQANRLEKVLTDLKSRDFIQSPKIQELMAKVTVKSLNTEPLKKAAASAASKARTSEKAFRGKLKALESQIGPQVAKNLINTIMARAEEIRASYWKSGDGQAPTGTKSASGKSKSKKTTSKKSTTKKAKSGAGRKKG